VPLLVVDPRIPTKGSKAAAPVELLDLYPTLADLCGIKPPAALDGKSLRPMLNDTNASVKPAAFTQVKHGNASGYAVTDGRYRYIHWNRGKDGVQLYDLHDDPHELRNLTNDPSHTEKLGELRTSILTLKNLPDRKSD